MTETAQQLYEKHTQRGSPSMMVFSKIQKEMIGMDFRVTREAAQFATEAHIHHMCAVANLVKTCCLGGPAHTLVTSLGPERFTERRRALINEATGKMPRLFGALENGVLSGKFEPGVGTLVYVLPTPGYDINQLMEDMAKLRKLLKALRRAELIAAREHDRVRAAGGGGALVKAPDAPSTHGRRTSGADKLRREYNRIHRAARLEQRGNECPGGASGDGNEGS
jgi:hypothetical protein